MSGGQLVITTEVTELVVGSQGETVIAVEQALVAVISVAEQGPPGPPGPPGQGSGGGLLSISMQTEDFTLAAADLATMIFADKATPLIATLPNSLPAGFNCTVAQEGAGLVYFVAGAGATIQSPQGPEVETAVRYGAAVLLVKDNAGGEAADWRLRGDLTAGAPPGAPPGGHSDEVQQFLDRLATPPTGEREALYAALIDGLVSDGVWAKLDALWVFSAADGATALTNLVQDAYNATLIEDSGAPLFLADYGFARNPAAGAGNFVSSNFNPTAATTPNYALNSAAVFCWSLDDRSDAGEKFLFADNGRRLEFDIDNTGNVYWGRNNKAQDFSAAAGADINTSALFTNTRTANDLAKFYRNATEVASTTLAADVIPNSNIVFFYGPAGLNWPAEKYIGAGGISSGLTAADVTALHGRLLTYLQAVGAVP